MNPETFIVLARRLWAVRRQIKVTTDPICWRALRRREDRLVTLILTF